MLGTAWPALPYAEWADTYRTLHLWTQMVGKVRLAQTPWLNHSWQTPLYLTPRGLTTGLIPHDERDFDLEFDFVDEVLRLRTDEVDAVLPLAPMPVSVFFHQVMGMLAEADVPVTIDGAPNELPEAIPFTNDNAPRIYDAAQAERFWRVLARADRVFKRFRTGFLGKASPVHFFWGSFDLAVTRFSGRPARAIPAACRTCPTLWRARPILREVSSAGFLARRSRLRGSGVLFLRLARAAKAFARRFRSCRRRDGSTRAWANSSCPTRRCARRPIRRPC